MSARQLKAFRGESLLASADCNSANFGFCIFYALPYFTSVLLIVFPHLYVFVFMSVACFCECNKHICDSFICSIVALRALIELILLTMLLLFCLPALPL